jgi:hypothetical protein
MMKLLLLSVIATSLVGCSTGPEVLTGQVYPEIEDYTAVSVWMEMPERAEKIAVLRASSGWGTGNGQFPENAEGELQRRIAVVEDLQRRAAKLGANAVVLTRLDPIGRDGAQMVGGQSADGGRKAILFRTQFKIVEGIAIFVK